MDVPVSEATAIVSPAQCVQVPGEVTMETPDSRNVFGIAAALGSNLKILCTPIVEGTKNFHKLLAGENQ